MKKSIGLEDIPFSNKLFWLGFVAFCFPNAYDEEYDVTIADMLVEFAADENFFEYWDDLTGYYDGVMDENDGYVDEPATFSCRLQDGHTLKIEFHPGDVVFYMDDTQIGCTGPHFKLEAYAFSSIEPYAESNRQIFMLMLPLAKIQKSEYEKASSILADILKNFIDNIFCDDFASLIINGLLFEN